MKVLLVDDHAIVVNGLRALFTTAGIEVVGAVDDGAAAAQAVVELEPDLVLMDLSMPVVDGITATRAVLAARAGTKVVVLTSFAEHDKLHEALEAGAVGYLLKDADPEDILRGVRDAAAGGVPLSPRAATALLPRNRPATRGTLDSLTPRERDVLALVAQGMTNKGIGRRLAISEKTVKAHLSHVFAVVGVTDRTSAALWAQRHGGT